MLDPILDFVFGCHHRHLTRPVTPVDKRGKPGGNTYVVCLDCGRQFAYDVHEMRMGKAIEHPEGVLPANMPKPRRSKLKHAVWAVPLGAVIGAIIHSSRKNGKRKPGAPASGQAG